MRRLLPTLTLAAGLLAACGAQTTAAPTVAPVPTAATTVPTIASATSSTGNTQPGMQADLSGVKTYLLDKSSALTASTANLKAISDQYYTLAKEVNFDYAALQSSKNTEVTQLISEARTAWITASPLYEQMEGIVAGVPSLAEYDVILDAGASGAEGGENAVPFDLTLPDGKVLPKPGNLFGVTESTLWGTTPEYSAANTTVTINDAAAPLPDANVLKGGVDTLDKYANELAAKAQGWQPTETDAFNALVTMVPTMSEYFDSWKNSRFVAGEQSTQRDFVAISRLSDIQNILDGLLVVHQNVSPRIQAVDKTQDEQIGKGLTDLKAFVGDVYAQEQSGKRFTAEDADLLGAEAQNRATAITGQISQVAARLNVPLEQ